MLRRLLEYWPSLQHQLRVAHLDETPEEFLKKLIVRTASYTLLLGFGAFMLFDRQGWSMAALSLLIVLIAFFTFWFGSKKPDIISHRRAIDIDREVLFAGRFLLIKLHSGKPLVNALIEASHSYGVGSRYFAEIVRDIELGSPLEDAIERAMTYTSSNGFRKILFQIHTALRLGIDVTQSLEAVLEDITQDQMLQIQKYGKKLPSATLFYMIIAIVFPSLGMTIMTIILTFANISMDMGTYGIVLFFLVVLNFMFITVFRAIRPKVNI